MRTRRAFRPVVETMSSRLLTSSLAVTDPTAPVQVPSAPPTSSPLPTDPIKIMIITTTDDTYVGPDSPTSLDPTCTINA